MNRKYLIIGGVVVLAIIIIALVLFSGGKQTEPVFEQGVSDADPVDIVLDFYDQWLAALLSTSTDPYELGLYNNPILSKELRTRLASTKGHPDTEPDPVLCQTTILEGISTRTVYQNESGAQILVVSTQKELTNQAVVTLKSHDGGLYIDGITCTLGEYEEEREFSFEREGFVLRSVVPPLDPRYLHLIFEENNEKGHAAPLFFDNESMCKDLDGNTSVCNLDNFIEPLKVFVRGQLTETGVEVKQMEYLK